MNQKATKEITTKNTAEFDIWDGSVATGFAGGSGTAANPYLISSASQLAYLRDAFNKSVQFSAKVYVLTNNIDLMGIQWTPIGLSNLSRSILFDGNNHIIRGLSVISASEAQGFFGRISTASSITNLTIENGFVSGSSSVGGIAGMYSGNIENCHFSGTVNIRSNQGGGIVGRLVKGSIINCSNTGKFLSNENAIEMRKGGIVGWVNTGTILNCSNSGEISGSHLIGGIAGSVDNGIIKCCVNTGTVQATQDTSGGIAGSGKTIEMCLNSGKVIGGGTDGYTAGIAALATDISHCLNNGAIEANTNAGGILSNPAVGVTNMLVENCYNTGKVTAKLAKRGTGGIVANLYHRNIQIKNCYNEGLIIAEDALQGGLLGEVDFASEAVITNSHYLLGSAVRGTNGSGNISYNESITTFVNATPVIKNIQDTEKKLQEEREALAAHSVGAKNITRILDELAAIQNVLSRHEAVQPEPLLDDMILRLNADKTLNFKESKKETITIIGLIMLYKNFKPAFVAGLLGNIFHEGEIGYFENSNYSSHPELYPSYLKYMDQNYNYRQEYSGQYIMNKSLAKADSLLQQLEKDNWQKGKFGLGSVQWTGSRTRNLMDLYLDVAYRNKITYNEAAVAEAELIALELGEGGTHRSVYKKWEAENAGSLNSDSAAYNAGIIICDDYEKPGLGSKTNRAETAKAIYKIMTTN